jgi:putative ABC transport system permease protein
MNIYDVVKLAWKQLTQRRLRTILTILAVAVGVMVIIALSSHARGIYVSFIANFERLGPTTIIVSSTGTRLLSDVDVYRISELPGVSIVIPMRTLSGNVEGLNVRATVVGVRASELKELLGGDVNLLKGNPLTDTPIPIALIGYNIAHDQSSGSEVVDVGQTIAVRVGTRTYIFSVVGILNYYGSSFLLSSPDDSIYIPLDYFRRVSGVQGYSVVIVKASDVNVVSDVADNIRMLLGARARVTTVQSVVNTFTNILNQMNLLLVSIASTSFIAAGLGTFNIMMVSVLERVREIGLLKALGMSDTTVLLLYLIQGLLIGLIGGLSGFGLGIVLSQALTHIFSLTIGPRSLGPGPQANPFTSYTPVLDPQYTLIAVVLSLTTTAVASIYPSWRASKLSPVEALRYE